MLTGGERKKEAREDLTRQLDTAIAEAQRARFDIDEETQDELEEPARPPSPVTLPELAVVLASPELLPAGMRAAPLDGPGEMRYEGPGAPRPVRVTTDAEFYTDHPDSVELWSPGSPLFRGVETDAPPPQAPTLGALIDRLKAANHANERE